MWRRVTQFAERAARRMKGRNALDDAAFRALAAATGLLFACFFMVAIARIGAVEVGSTRAVAAGWRPRAKTQGQQGQERPASRAVEYIGGIIDHVFHHHWLGFFSHWDTQRHSFSLDETQGEQALARNRSAQSGELWYIGVVLSSAGSLFVAVGNHLVALSARLAESEAASATRNGLAPPREMNCTDISLALFPSNRAARLRILDVMQRRSTQAHLWGNMLIIVLGTALSLVSFLFASQALLAPLSGLTIVFNAGLAATPCFGTSNKAASRNSLWATLLTLAGCVFVLMAGPRGTPQLSLDDLTSNFVRPLFVILLLATASSVTVLVHRRETQGRSPFLDFAQCAVPGVLGGFCNVCASAVSLLAAQGKLFGSLISICMLLCSVAAAALQLVEINRSLLALDPLVVVPVYQASLLVASTLFGASFYGMVLSPIQLLAFLIGVSGIIAGVALLSTGQVPEPAEARAKTQV